MSYVLSARASALVLTLCVCAFPSPARSETAINSIGVPGPSRGKSFNPDISANFLGLLQRSTAISDDRTQVPHNGLSLQEAELQLAADVDPYLRASVLLSLHQEGGGTEFGIDPEEVFLETLSLPSLSLRAGKFKLALGKHNLLHTHAYPFIDAPLIHQNLLGDEGLNEVAISAAILIPAAWYSEIILQGFNPANEELFASPRSGDWGGLARFKNLFDLSDSLTMEVGASGVMGTNQFDKTSSTLGADLTFKWRPAEGGKYRALIWATEYLYGQRPGRLDDAGQDIATLGGFATWLQFQFAQRWWIQGRYEAVGIPKASALPDQVKQSALLGFFPSEFSGIRLQYDHLLTDNRHDHALALQYNVSIGAHPAHAY
ncbi:MAG: hypothetical protein AB7P04_01675 [Bacteriovoracia bacterium]